MLEIPATVKVFLSGKEIKPERDGFLGEFKELKEKFVLEITPREEGLFLPLRGRTKPVSPKNQGKEIILEPIRATSSPNGEPLYLKEIAIHESEKNNGLPVTKWPKNNVKLVHIKKTGDEFVLYFWEVGIVTQIFNSLSGFFLVMQCAHKSIMRKNKFGKIILPEWPEANGWLALWNNIDIYINPESIPLCETSPKNTPPPNEKLGENMGRVLWYNFAYQIGAVEMSDQNRRVYWSEIETSERFKYLKEGQKVMVKGTRLAINTYAYPRITEFKEDALGVVPLSS